MIRPNSREIPELKRFQSQKDSRVGRHWDISSRRRRRRSRRRRTV
jgi:hypothetical protein